MSPDVIMPPDELFQVELRIAQRADELARLYGTDPINALDHWRQAEREIWRDPLERPEHTSPAIAGGGRL